MREHIIELSGNELTEQTSLQEHQNPETAMNGRPSVDMNGLSRCPMQEVTPGEGTNTGAIQPLVFDFEHVMTDVAGSVRSESLVSQNLHSISNLTRPLLIKLYPS